MGVSKLACKVRKIIRPRKCGAVIVAAGTASRMEGIDKVMAPLGGEPMLLRTVRAFQESDVIHQIVVVTRKDLLQQVKSLCKHMDKVTAVVTGGKDRADSVRRGLAAMSDKVGLVAIQDGARPLISQRVIDRTVRAAHTYGAAAPGVPVKNTIKLVRDGIVVKTPERSSLRAIQTPQVFDVYLLKGALKEARIRDVELTDDCSAVELLGMKVKIVEGEEQNIKITTPMDLRLAQMLLEEPK